MEFDFEDAPDEVLLRRYVESRDQDAISALVRRHESRVYGLAYRLLGNRADAADASQDAFVLLIRKAKSFKGESAFSTWLFRIVTNACHDLRRRSARSHELPSPDLGGGASAIGIDSAERIDIQRALLKLLPEQREALVLRDIIGFSYQEIADVTRAPIGTVKSRIARGRIALAEILGNPVDEGTRLSERER